MDNRSGNPIDNIRLKSIQVKIAFWAGCCLLLAAAVIIAYTAISIYSTTITMAEEEGVALAQMQANRIDAEIEVALDAARTLAQTLSALKNRTTPIALSRVEVNVMIRQVLASNPKFVGISNGWEPDAFDGKDAQYIDSTGHDETGRFIPYWSRNGAGQITLEPLVDYATADWYVLPKQTGQETIVEPYIYPVQGEDVLMTTLAAPIVANGQFYGMVGVDITLDFLQRLADEMDIDNGAGQLFLISNQGLLAGVTGRPELVGQSIDSLDGELKEHINKFDFHQNEVVFKHDNQLEILVPIEFGRSAAPWWVMARISLERATAKAYTLVWQLIGIGVLLAGAGLALLWVVAGRTTRPIRGLIQVAQALASGNLDVEALGNPDDETGVLAAVFNRMIGSLRQILETERQANEAMKQAMESQVAKEQIEAVVTEYLAFVERVAAGDLTARLSVNGRDDALTVLGRNLNEMAQRLGEMTRQMRQATLDLTSAAAEILAATRQQAAGANEQSAAIAQTSTTIDEVKNIVEQAFGRAQLVAEQAQQTRDTSRVGQQAVLDTVSSMSQIKDRVEGIAENILALSERTQQIGQIIATVNEIAAQSNLLALNASVEAARAGEHGRGFAVVAVEVRNLAEQSRQATAQVKGILNDIQRATNAAVMATEEGTRGTDIGVQRTEQAGETIQQLAASIGQSASAAQQIVASAQQQTTGMEQIAVAMQNINQVTLQNLASTRQAEKAAQDLANLARYMESLVAAYKLND